MKIIPNYSLLHHNTFGIDARAACFVEYETPEELVNFLVNGISESRLPLLCIGGGSNLLFTSDYRGTVLHSAIKGYEVVNETSEYVDVCVGSGEKWDDVVAYAVSNKWYGVENLSFIPGDVGASAVQNIGAYGVEVKDLIVSVSAVCVSDGTSRTFTNEECCYAYRESVFKKELKGQYIITDVTYRFSKKAKWNLDYGNIRTELAAMEGSLTLESLREVIRRIRERKLPDPVQIGNAGSFFMNPIIQKTQYDDLCGSYPDMPCYPVCENKVKIPAGWMIDRCGWKGKTIGRVGVHEHQALVLVNRGGATGKEVMDLAALIAASVFDKFGIMIYPEVNYI